MQGESQSQGIVLSNLGRIYLQMEQATAAREPLERAVLLISRQTKPYYQNALYCLAKTYSSLAKNCLQGISSEQQRLTASSLFVQSADRYQELASILADGQAEIKVAAAIAECRSYLARLGGQVQDMVALQLTEKAQASLDIAAANARDSKKAGILGLQRIIAGMKEAHSIGLLANEPLMQTRAITNASECLMGGAQGWASEEASGFLCQALKNINAGAQVQISGRDPAEKLQAAAAALRQASAAEKYGKEKSANMIVDAAEILEGSAVNVSGQCQLALLLIAGAMASDSLSKIEDSNSIMTWDESLQTEPNPKPIKKTDLPVLEISTENGWLVPIKADVACKSSSQFLFHEERPQEGGIKEAGPEFHEAPPDPEIEKRTQKSPFSRSNAVFLLKVLTALLAMLLAIEAILYLI
jgi:hypothetical protein